VILLLDTHALLWALSASRQLSEPARSAILEVDNDVLVSAASGWEIAIKKGLGRLQAPDDLVEAVAEAGFRERPILLADTLRLNDLPDHHRDPFDRMLVAQALVDGATIVSRDRQLARYGVALLW
jgi:PIN domain nuclease of toxin-antitoxin system